ncbi:MAG: leucine-rich repeat domain-containing protein [Promethearchaeota archaeon]
MHQEDRELTCTSCGLPLAESEKISRERHLLCAICTLNGTSEPEFETAVYALAVGYFINKLQIDDPKEALNRAHEFVNQLPFWRDKGQPTPSLAGLKTARILTALSSRMNTLEFDEERLTPPDFFISYSWTGPDKELVDPLVTTLKDRGYNIWYDKETWGTESGKTKDWMRRGVNNARHCVVILSQPYFDSEACMYELNTILTTKDEKYIFPVWWKDVDKKFLQKQEYGKKLLDIVGIGWDDWQGDIDTLVNTLTRLSNYAEGLQEYNEVPLVADDARVLERLQVLTAEPIPPLKHSPDNENKAVPNFGFYHEDNRVTALFLKNRGLKTLPKSIGQCSALKSVYLEQNQLKSLPESLYQLTNLQTLSLSENQINFLPEAFSKLTKLTSLNLDSNGLNTLPESIGNLKNLKKLNLHNNGLRSLSFPSSFFLLINLQTLNLENNRLRHLPLSFAKLTKLKKLKLTKNQLTVLPEDFTQLIKLQNLDLANNQLDALPEDLGNLTNLAYLNLQMNQLSSLPGSFGQLQNLQFLDLSHNELESLPENFSSLTKLESLNLGRNQLESLPESFGQLQNLEALELYSNQFESLPENFGDLKNLNFLLLHKNRLTSLPESFGNLSNLQVLNLKNNRFESLPGAIRKLRARGCNVKYSTKKKNN